MLFSQTFAAIRAWFAPEPSPPKRSDTHIVAIRAALSDWLTDEEITRAWVLSGQLGPEGARWLLARVDSMDSDRILELTSALLKNEWVRSIITERMSRRHGLHPSIVQRDLSEWARV